MSHNKQDLRGEWPLGYHTDDVSSKSYGMAKMDTNRPLYQKLTQKCTVHASKLKFLLLTFRPQYHGKSIRSLTQETIRVINQSFHKIANLSLGYHAYPELTESGNLHWHVLVHTSNFVKLKNFINYWNRRYGRVFPKDLGTTTMDYWRTWFYARKESLPMLKLLKCRKWNNIVYYIPSNISYKYIVNHMTSLITKRQTEQLKYIDLIALTQEEPQASSPTEDAERSDSE